jgi:SulP family sulfate permease
MVSSIQEETQSQSWIPILTSGLVLGITLALTGIIPMAALIFTGKLERFMATGISLALMSATVLGIVLAIRSSFVGVVAFVVAEEATILGAMATTIDESMSANATDADILTTIIAAIALATLLTGIFLFILGKFRLGELIRFLPYPVIGGFLAGLGYLITNAGFRTLTNGKHSLLDVTPLFQPDTLLRWAPAMVLAIILLAVTRRSLHFLALPGIVVGAIGLFYLVLLITQTPVAQASKTGWLLGPFPAGSQWNPTNLGSLWQANWSLVFPQLGNIAVLMLITALSLLLVSSVLELVTERDIDLNQELRATGLGNILCGLLGGMVGSHAVSALLAEKMGVRSRLVGIVIAFIYLGLALAGLSLLTFFPRPVLGGLILFIGLDLLVLQLYDGWFRLSKIDYAIVLVVMAIVVLFGFVAGVVVGLVIAIIQFAINYSRISVSRYTLSGSSISSHRKRPLNQERLLQNKGDQIYLMTLQGFIFFGTANKLVNQVRKRVEAIDQQPPQFVVLDFHWVTGLDSSAISSFAKFKQFARKQEIQILFTDLLPALHKSLRQAGVLATNDPVCHEFTDLDHGVEWCEEQLLESSQYRRARALPLSLQLKTFFSTNNDQISIFMTYLEPLQVKETEYLFHQAETPDRLYFVESGEVSTIRELDTGKTQRVQTLSTGTIVGEVEFYTQVPYALAAIADRPCKLYCLHRSALKRMQDEHPQIANLFSELMNSVLANRLTYMQREISSLTR